MALSADTKKRLILSVVNFLQKEADQSDPDKKESIEVAVQCLESAFNVDYAADSSKYNDIPNLESFFIVNLTPEKLAEAEESKNKGNELMHNGLYQEAVEHYSKAININPNNAVYYCNRAAAYSRLECHENSIADCEQAVKIDPNYAKAYGRLGIAYSALNKYREARDAYRRALVVDPGNAIYEENLKLAEERLGSTGPEMPPQMGNVDIGQFMSNPNLLNMASQMLNDPNVRNVMSGLLNMGNEGGGNPNIDALLQMGQQLAQQMQINNPGFVDNLRRQFQNAQDPAEGADNPNQSGDTPNSDENNSAS